MQTMRDTYEKDSGQKAGGGRHGPASNRSKQTLKKLLGSGELSLKMGTVFAKHLQAIKAKVLGSGSLFKRSSTEVRGGTQGQSLQCLKPVPNVTTLHTKLQAKVRREPSKRLSRMLRCAHNYDDTGQTKGLRANELSASECDRGGGRHCPTWGDLKQNRKPA